MIRELHTDVLAILTTNGLDAYGSGTVPNLPPTPYVVVYFSRRGVGGGIDRARLSDRTTGVGWRVETLHVGSTVREAEWAEDKVSLILENRRLEIDGHETTPLHLETSQGIAADLGVENLFTGMSSWTCVSAALQPA